jgi:hypothetical protein
MSVLSCIGMYSAFIGQNNTYQYNQYKHESIENVFKSNVLYQYVLVCIYMYWHVLVGEKRA